MNYPKRMLGYAVLAATFPAWNGQLQAQTPQELDSKSAGGLFARMWRTAACPEAKQPSFPSVVVTQQGRLLLLFTAKDIQTNMWTLVLSQSDNSGKTWSKSKVVYRSAAAQPRAMGTLTRLKSGRMLAPFLDGSKFQMLHSHDDGDTWRVTQIDVDALQGATPYGRLVELPSELLMPIYGNLQHNNVNAPCSGLLRSRDGGKTWSEFTVIACDRQHAKVNYGATAVHADRDGQMLALITVGGYLYRSVSTDAGRSWSQPDQRLIARHAALAQVGSVLACANEVQGGIVRVQFSENLFDSWRCDRMLDQDLKGHYFSAVGLDQDRLLFVYDRGDFKPEGRGTSASQGIEVAMMQRNPACPPVPKIQPPHQRDRWELEPSKTFSYVHTAQPSSDGKCYSVFDNKVQVSTDLGRSWKPIANPPPLMKGHSQGFSLLPSGRWMITDNVWLIEDWDGKRDGYIGPDGYYYLRTGGVKGTNRSRSYYSDDQGQTWSGGDDMDFDPLVWRVAGNNRIHQEADGTLVRPVYGCFTEKDTSRRIDCCGVIRSHDGGKTWGDFSLVAYDKTHQNIAYNEFDFQPRSDGTWVAIIRTEWRNHHSGEASSSSVSFSTDRGRTWTKPQYAFIGAVPDMVQLPDGAVVVATSFSKIRFSYDGGHTWSRELPSLTSHYPAIDLLDENHLLTYGQGKASVYRRIPAGN